MARRKPLIPSVLPILPFLLLAGCASLFGGGEPVYEPPRLTRMVQPFYPNEARLAGTTGWVRVTVHVAPSGEVSEVEVLESDPAGVFDGSARKAVMQWRYQPATRDGEPVAAVEEFTLQFALAGGPEEPKPPAPPGSEPHRLVVIQAEAPRRPPPPPPPGAKGQESPIFLAYEKPPRLVHMEQPTYPEVAREAGIEGRVVLSLVVDEEGRVIDAEVIVAQPPDVFEEAALEAVKQWRYEPAHQKGEPVKVRVGQSIEFSLPEEEETPAEEEGSPIHMEYDEPPVLLHMEAPKYPEAAREEGVEGKVVFSIVIDEEGKVVEAEVVTSEPEGIFEETAREALMKWRYEPATVEGRPVKVRVGQTVEFTLSKKPPPMD